MRVPMGADSSVAANRVKDALMRATIQVPGVEKDPPPQIFVSEYGDSGIIYQIKFTMRTHTGYYEVRDGIYTNAWYEFRRLKITIPYPQRVLHLERKTGRQPRKATRKHCRSCAASRYSSVFPRRSSMIW